MKDAYKKVIGVNHPDVGGTAYLAEKVNEARDLLLKKGGSGTSGI